MKRKPTFAWRSPSRRKPIVRRLVADFVTDNVVAELRRNPPKHFVSDDPNWVDRAAQAVGSAAMPDAFSVLADRLPAAFATVATYHACRPEHPELYAVEGFRVLDPLVLQDEALRLFPANEQDIRNAIDELGVATREGVVHFALDDIFLMQHCGHYLIHGSEYLQGIAAAIQSRTGRDLFSCLSSRGVPTIFACNLPFSLLEPGDVRELAGQALTSLLEGLVMRARFQASIHFTFTVHDSVPPVHIVSHYHPTDIPNPHEWGRSYVNSAQCALCAA